MMMSYLYCGGTESLKTNVKDLLEVRTALKVQIILIRLTGIAQRDKDVHVKTNFYYTVIVRSQYVMVY